MELLDKKEFAVAAYKPFYDQLQELEKNNTAIAFDYESAKGNKEARSHVYKLRQSKAALEKTRKDEKAESLRIGKAIDSEAKEIEARIEAMIAVHQVKLDEIEKRETDRILAALSEIHHEGTTADYRYHLATLEQVKIDDSWQEFAVEASQAKDQSIAKHRELLAAREKADAEAAELEALRKAAAEREQRDRDEKIAQEAAAKLYRIKPEPKKGWYRVGLLKTDEGEFFTTTADSTDPYEDPEQTYLDEWSEDFVRWLTDRIEYTLQEGDA